MPTDIGYIRFHQHQTREICPPIQTAPGQPHKSLQHQLQILHFHFHNHYHYKTSTQFEDAPSHNQKLTPEHSNSVTDKGCALKNTTPSTTTITTHTNIPSLLNLSISPPSRFCTQTILLTSIIIPVIHHFTLPHLSPHFLRTPGIGTLGGRMCL